MPTIATMSCACCATIAAPPGARPRAMRACTPCPSRSTPTAAPTRRWSRRPAPPGTTRWRMAERHGVRNAQVTVIAPTGTIGLVMDCDTTGIEPDFALVKFKKLAGGGYFKIINRMAPTALATLGYTPEQIEAIGRYAVGHGTLVGAPGDQPCDAGGQGLRRGAAGRSSRRCCRRRSTSSTCSTATRSATSSSRSAGASSEARSRIRRSTCCGRWDSRATRSRPRTPTAAGR